MKDHKIIYIADTKALKAFCKSKRINLTEQRLAFFEVNGYLLTEKYYLLFSTEKQPKQADSLSNLIAYTIGFCVFVALCYALIMTIIYQ